VRKLLDYLLLCFERFLLVVVLVGHVEAVLTKRMAYDSWVGAVALLLAGIVWAIGDRISSDLSKEEGDK
jgi:hypothetical protein